MTDMIQMNGQLVDATPFIPSELLGGRADRFHVSVQSVTLSGGGSIDFSQKGVTAIVGANNVGKTTLLHEIVNRLAAQPQADFNNYKAVESVTLSERSSLQDLTAWFMVNATFKLDGSQKGFVRGARQHPFALDVINQFWRSGQIGTDRLWELSNYLVHHSSPFDRAAHLGGTSPRVDFTEPPVHPMHYMQDNEGMLNEIDSYCRRIFGESLTIDYLSANVQFRVGESKIPAPPVDKITQEYRQALAALPTLRDQGDGMKSLMGLLITLVATPFPIVFIDEPEAFMHPPQAVALGKILGELSVGKGMQIILATHDKNLLAGLMSSGAPTSVVRVDRRGARMRADRLESNALQELWKNPSLRYSNVLDGLFHKLVVIAEADPDCRFYAAAMESLLESSPEDQFSSDDILWVPSGGLGEMPKLAEALRELSVPMIVCPDMDVFSNSGTVEKMIKSLGGDWSLYRDLDRKLRAPFSVPRSPRTVGVVLAAITGAFNGREGEKYAAEHKKFVEAELYVDSVWREVKKFGLKGFPGESRVAASSFMKDAEAIGFVPLHAGELESLSDVAVSKGPGWLPAALEAGSHESSDSRTHVSNIVNSANVILRKRL
ncbi:ATP-dependent endonuclease [Streptomyces virginiae]|uniref:ATP-dependent nuclease n=1 Tax=Streptomyces virginiae TaxID=1961 RepID=UPI00364A62EA